MAVWRLVTAWNQKMESAMLALNSTENMLLKQEPNTSKNQSRLKVLLVAMLGCLFWVSNRPDQTTPFNQSWMKAPLVAMLGCLFWVSPISVQHISLQPTRSNHTVQSIQNERTPGCYVRLSLLSLSHLRPTHLPPADQIKPHRSINPEWKYPWVLC